MGAEYGEGGFRSYVNNVDPTDTALIGAIESIVLRFIPLWERVLSDLATKRKPVNMYVKFEHSDSDDSEYWVDGDVVN